MTDETKHTAGPWTWYGDELLSPSEFVMGASKGNWPKDNDARLIGAAPEMLAALKAAVSQVHLTNSTEPMSPDVKRVFDQCCAAIAKAEARKK